MYKERIQQLLETLNTKIGLVEDVSNGSLKLSKDQVSQLISDIKKISEQISTLVEAGR
jgi:hypothetical protein